MQQFILNKGKPGITNDGSRALQGFVDIYIKGHRGGWSAFPTECYCHDPDFVMRDGDRSNEPFLTDKAADPLFIEWVYVIDIENKKLIIYTHGRAKGETEEKVLDRKTKEVRKWSSPNYTHYLVCELDINPDTKEPDWEAIEKTGSDISNKMYEKYNKEVESARS